MYSLETKLKLQFIRDLFEKSLDLSLEAKKLQEKSLSEKSDKKSENTDKLKKPKEEPVEMKTEVKPTEKPVRPVEKPVDVPKSELNSAFDAFKKSIKPKLRKGPILKFGNDGETWYEVMEDVYKETRLTEKHRNLPPSNQIVTKLRARAQQLLDHETTFCSQSTRKEGSIISIYKYFLF